jgi:hypothetical protein
VTAGTAAAGLASLRKLTAIAFSLDAGVTRLSLLPFIPRGDGAAREAEFALSHAERRALRQAVCAHRRWLAGRLDLRWLDFATDTAPVVEADGRVLLEGPREARDTLLAIIPAPPKAAPSRCPPTATRLQAAQEARRRVEAITVHTS